MKLSIHLSFRALVSLAVVAGLVGAWLFFQSI